jgi:hypothetical protein
MPDIDRTADVKVSVGREPVTAEIPLAGHASEHWLELFRLLAKNPGPGHLEANDRDDRTWVIVTLPSAGPARNPDPELALDAASALIAKVNVMEQESQQPPRKPKLLSAVGGRVSNGSGHPAARPDPLLRRSSAGPHQTPRTQLNRDCDLSFSSREIPRMAV